MASSTSTRMAERIAKAMQAENTILVAEVIRHEGPGVSIAKDMTLDDAITVLTRKRDEEEEMKGFSSIINAFPYDGAYALKLAMEEMFGYVINAKCFCGQTHNRELQIVTDARGTKTLIPWGEFHVPGVEGEFGCSVAMQGKRLAFKITAHIKTKHGPIFDRLVELVEKNVRERSLYKGKALNVQFKDEDGDTHKIPEIRFVDVADAPAPIFNSALTDKLENDILAFITHSELARELNGGTLKRGALLAGPYGCGKTLTAKYLADQATQRGWTFFYIDHPDEFYEAHLLARLFQPAVIFVEDVESIAGHDRDTDGSVNKLLNVLDGADSKMFDIISIFTTNHGEKISRAMFRPGRLDIVMAVQEPDAEAAVRLAIHYSGGNVDPETDMSEAGEKLAGKIPATIQEAVSRARRRAVLRTGQLDAWITGTDLVNAANSIDTERNSYQDVSTSVVQEYGQKVGKFALEAASASLNHKN